MGELDQQPGAGPLVRIGVEGDVEARGAGVVDEREELVRAARMGLAVVEVGDVGRRSSAPPDLDGLLERIEEPVTERVADVGVVEATLLPGGSGQLGELLRRGVAAGGIVEARAQADGAVRDRVAEGGAHPIDGLGVCGDVVPAKGGDAELAVPDQRADVHADRAVVAGEVIGDGSPVVVDVWPAIQTRVEVHERLEVLATVERREPVAVDADDFGRDTLADLGLVPRLGEDDQTAVTVQVDEPGGNDAVRGVDGGAGVGGRLGVGGEQPHPITLDDDRARPWRRTRPIHDRAAGDEDVDAIGHRPESAAIACAPGDHIGPWRSRVRPDSVHLCTR